MLDWEEVGVNYYDPSVSADWEAISSVLAGYFACLAIFIIAIIALMIVAYWKILQKAGYNGAWSLLILVPGINTFASLGILLFLAFSDWPALRTARGATYPPPQVRYPSGPPPAGPGYVPPTGPGYAPPGYSPPPPPMSQGAGSMAPPAQPTPPPPMAPPMAQPPMAPPAGPSEPAPEPPAPAEPAPPTDSSL